MPASENWAGNSSVRVSGTGSDVRDVMWSETLTDGEQHAPGTPALPRPRAPAGAVPARARPPCRFLGQPRAGACAARGAPRLAGSQPVPPVVRLGAARPVPGRRRLAGLGRPELAGSGRGELAGRRLAGSGEAGRGP